jgi:multidrug resistance efflux pump
MRAGQLPVLPEVLVQGTEMIDLARWQKLKAAAEAARRDRDRAIGALRQAKTRLKQEHGCTDLRAAKAKLAGLAEMEASEEAEFKRLLGELEREWASKLGENDAP